MTRLWIAIELGKTALEDWKIAFVTNLFLKWNFRKVFAIPLMPNRFMRYSRLIRRTNEGSVVEKRPL